MIYPLIIPMRLYYINLFIPYLLKIFMSESQKKILPKLYNQKKEGYILEDAVYEDGMPLNNLRILCWKILSSDDCSRKRSRFIQAKEKLTNTRVSIKVDSNSLISIADELIGRTNYSKNHKYFQEHDSILLEIGEMDELMKDSSLLVFVNGFEPKKGMLSLSKIFPVPGDLIMICLSEKSYYKNNQVTS